MKKKENAEDIWQQWFGEKAKNRKEEGLVLEDTKIYNKITTTKFIHYWPNISLKILALI